MDFGTKTTNDSRDFTILFDKAKEDFLASLSPDEKAQFSLCSSPETLLNEVKKFEVLSKNKRRSLLVVQKIQSLTDSLTPYFKVVGIFCGTCSEWTRVAWGALLLVTKLASNFTTFFEKLCEVIYSLSLTIPQYQEALEVFDGPYRKRSPKSQVLGSFVRFYKDLFEFFQAVVAVFTKKNGRLRKTPVVIAELLWKPFDLRFREITERMKVHQNILKDGLLFMQFESIQYLVQPGETKKIMNNLTLRLDRSEHNSFCQNVMNWLAPPSFKTPFEEMIRKKIDGTSEWLFDDQRFLSWKQSSPYLTTTKDRILWIQGNPGCGKTILAASTIDELQTPTQHSTTGSTRIVCYYFFQESSSGKDRRADAYRALVAQILQQCSEMEQIRSIFALAFNKYKLGQQFASEDELLDLLGLCLPLLSDAYFVLDGIDECADESGLLKALRDVSRDSEVKTILFSRPNVEIMRRSIPLQATILLSKDLLNADIIKYLDRGVKELQELNLLPARINVISIRMKLLQRADGMFLWARLMMHYLRSPGLSRNQRIEEMSKTTPDGLADMYHRILCSIGSMDTPSRNLARMVFKWVVYSCRPITASELRPLVWHSDDICNQPDSLDDFEHAIIICCGGLVEINATNLQFVHLTASEFISSKRANWRNGKRAIPGPEEVNFDLALECISYINSSVPARPLSGDLRKPASKDQLSVQLPFLSYAATNWTRHANRALRNRKAAGADGLAAAIQRFLSSQFSLMAWIEFSFMYNSLDFLPCLSTLIDTGRSFNEDVNQSTLAFVVEEMSDFVTDLELIFKDWWDTLLERPHEIWNDVTAFFPSRFFAKTSAVSVGVISNEIEEDAEMDGLPIFSISRDLRYETGHKMAKLSIWSSPSFRAYWDDPTGSSRQQAELQRDSHGWTAKYEIFDIDNHKVFLGSTTIPLDPDEIMLSMSQSLEELPGFRHLNLKWKFPLRISTDLEVAVILRTVFSFDIDHIERGNSINYETSRVAMDFHESFSYNWPKNRQSASLSSYWYEWYISFDSKYLVFKEFKPLNQEVCAIFGIFRENLQFSVLLLAQTLLHDNRATPWHVAVHSKMQKVAISMSAALWFLHFCDDDSSLVGLDRSTLKTKPLKVASVSAKQVSGLNFSQCGRFLTVALGTDQPPLVIPLASEQSTLKSSSDNSNIIQSQKNDALQKKRTLPEHDNNGTGMLDRSFKIPKTGDGRAELLAGDSLCSQLIVRSGITLSKSVESKSVEMILSKHQDGEAWNTESLSLVRLPASLEASTVQTSVYWNNEPQEKIVIILNESSPQAYYANEQSRDHLPVVIRKDARALSTPTSSILNSEDIRTRRKWLVKGSTEDPGFDHSVGLRE